MDVGQSTANALYQQAMKGTFRMEADAARRCAEVYTMLIDTTLNPQIEESKRLRKHEGFARNFPAPTSERLTWFDIDGDGRYPYRHRPNELCQTVWWRLPYGGASANGGSMQIPEKTTLSAPTASGYREVR
ncbi:hypothetical protein ACW2Q0_02615 [Nocardia sp. R16R-3T]